MNAIKLRKPGKINQEARAFKTWEILISLAKSQQTITYGELAKRIGIYHRAVKFVLKPIQNYCLEEKLEPLTILVVNKHTGLPGAGFIAWDRSSIPEGRREVFKFPWEKMHNPFEFASDGTRFDALSKLLMKDPDSSEEVYRKVKDRGMAQQLFRRVILDAYGGKCALTGLSFRYILDAAHIIPWSECEPRYRMSPNNGILMTSVHHRLFDQELITISEDYRVLYFDPDMTTRKYTEFDKMLIKDLHMKPIRLPQNDHLWPDKKLIKDRNSRLKWFSSD